MKTGMINIINQVKKPQDSLLFWQKLKSFCAISFLFFFFFNITNAQINVISDLMQEKVSSAGSSYTGEILVRNYGTSQAAVKIYQTNVYSNCDGQHFYPEIDSFTFHSNAKWISFSPSNTYIPEGKTSRINYVVNIPNDTSLKGSYYSIIMIEGLGNEKQIEETAEPSSKKKKTSLGLSVNLRFGILVMTHIENSGTRKIEIKNVSIANEKSQQYIRINIENKGERSLRPDVWVELYNNITGAKININGKDKFEGIKSNIFPGSCIQQNIPVSSLPAGNYKALIIIDAKDEDIFGAEYNLLVK